MCGSRSVTRTNQGDSLGERRNCIEKRKMEHGFVADVTLETEKVGGVAMRIVGIVVIQFARIVGSGGGESDDTY